MVVLRSSIPSLFFSGSSSLANSGSHLPFSPQPQVELSKTICILRPHGNVEADSPFLCLPSKRTRIVSKNNSVALVSFRVFCERFYSEQACRTSTLKVTNGLLLEIKYILVQPHSNMLISTQYLRIKN